METRVKIIDSFKQKCLDGKAYKVAFADPTGIIAGTSYYYYAKNTSNKNIYLRPIDFNDGTFLIQIVKDGIFKLNGTVFNPDDVISSTIEMTSRNLNGNYLTYKSGLKIYFMNVLGTITWEENASVKLAKTVDYEMYNPSKIADTPINVIAPGQSFMAIFTNYGSSKLPYRVDVEWSEEN